MVNDLKIWWHRLSSWSLGRWLFSRMIALLIPYTGTVSPHVNRLTPGFAEVFLNDKRRHRNHLRSIHALALANLGEVTTGLALHFLLSPGQRAILTNLNVEYLKKARGKIYARAKIDAAHIGEGSHEVLANLYDTHGVIVASIKATWLVGGSKMAKI